MKTTVDIPDDIYLEAKAIASLRKLKIKDLIAKGLGLAVAEEKKSLSYPSPMETFQIIREKPLHSSEDVRRMIERADAERKNSWDDVPSEP